MAHTKKEVSEDPQSCFNKAGDDEPIFVLRAKDPIAPMVVKIWASLSEHNGTQPLDKTGQAWIIANQMRKWKEAGDGYADQEGEF